MSHGVISLVTTTERPFFIRWDQTFGQGREIHLDEHERVKTLVFYAAPRITMAETPMEVVIRDVGVRMVVTSGGRAERPQMPGWALRLKDHAQINMFCGPRAREQTPEGCVVCNDSLNEEYEAPPFGDYYCCTLCHAGWHHACARTIGGSPNRTLDPFLCPVCEADSR